MTAVPLPIATAGGGRSTLASLARVELTRLARHPLTILGVVAIAALVPVGTANPDVWRPALNGFGLLPLLMFVFAAVHLATTRDRRGGTGELVASLPAPSRTRTRALLGAAALAGTAFGAVWVAVAFAVVGPGGTMTVATYGSTGIAWTPPWFELAQPLLLAPAVLALAVALGHWWRHPVVAFVVPPVLFVSPISWVAPPVVESGRVEHSIGLVEVSTGAVAWHHAYLAGWLAVSAAAALAHHERRPVIAALAAVGLVGVTVGFVLGPLPYA